MPGTVYTRTAMQRMMTLTMHWLRRRLTINALYRPTKWLDTYQYRQSALTTAQVPLFLSVMTCHSLERTQANPLYLSENLIS